MAREGLGEQLGAGDLERRSLRAALARREPPEDGRALLGHAGAGDRLERGVQPPQPLVVLLHRQRVAPGVRSPLRLARVEPQPPEPRRQGAPLLAARRVATLLDLPRELDLLPRARHAGLERCGRAVILGVELGERAPGVHRLLGLLEVAVEDLRHPAEQRLLRAQVALHGCRSGAVRAHEVVERVRAGGGALHRLARLGPCRIERQRAGERPQRLLRPPEPLLLDVRQALEEPDPLDAIALQPR